MAIARGELRAVKDGRRTLVDVEHGLARMRSLPAAKLMSGLYRTQRQLGVSEAAEIASVK